MGKGFGVGQTGFRPWLGRFLVVWLSYVTSLNLFLPIQDGDNKIAGLTRVL